MLRKINTNCYFCIMNYQFTFILILFSWMISFGQVEEQEMFRLDENDISTDKDIGKTEIVSASRSGKYLEDLPITVYVITREEILKNGYTSLVDVLKDVPGIKVSQPGSGIEGETFLMRGLLGNYYAEILIDDIPIQPSVVSGMPIAEQLPIRQAERIEIILGPASSVYGADALAGVINIITKSSDRPAWAQADISLGNFGYYNLNVMIGGKVGKNKNVLEYTFFGNSGKREDMNVKYDVENNYDPSLYDPDYEYIEQPYYEGDSTSPKFNNLPQVSWLAGFGLGYRGFKFSYMKMLRRTHSSIGQMPSLYAYYDPLNFWGESMQRYTLSYEKSWRKFSSKTNISYLNYRLDNNSTFRMIFETGDRGKLYKYAASDDIQLEEIATYNFTPDLELTGGFMFQFSGNLPKTNDLKDPFEKSDYKPFSESVNVSDPVLGSFGFNPQNFYNIGGFLQLFYEIGKFTVVLGDRIDNHSIYGTSNNPRIAIMYKPKDKISVRASFGQAFRAPSLYYTYSSLAFPTGNGDNIKYATVPNPELKPEKFYSAELGFRYKISENFSTDIALYYHVLNNQFTRSIYLLDPDLYPNADDVIAFAYVNDDNSEAKLFGVQANFRLKEIIPGIHFNTDLYVSYAKGSEVLPNGLGNLNDYRQMPGWFVQFNLDISPFDSWMLILHNTYSSNSKKRFFPLEPDLMELLGQPTFVKNYYTLDIVTRYRISKTFQAFLKINNVLNAKYGGLDAYGGNADLRYNPQYGRNFQFGLSFSME